ncbi:GIY-YIG nuclease family protein [Nocardioides sp. CN2-186]|uniref:GIY-YIG nuclease family protein n=1 Tax=Nocardioides tweenelious TaxID=3156607 RepID=UPI0032B4F23A
MAWTYILECADGSFYVGSTIDLDRRIGEHDAGVAAAYTRPRRRRPVRLVWAAQFSRIDDAFAYEKRVQGWSRAKRTALIEGRFDELPSLASRAWRYRSAVGSPGFETVAAQPPQPAEETGG